MNSLERVLIRTTLRDRKLRRSVEPIFEGFGDQIQGATVVDVGCGPGRGAGLVLRRGAGRVFAYDQDPTMVTAARHRLSSWGDRVVVEPADALALPMPDRSVDGVIELQALHHVEDWQAAIGEIARVLKPEGWFWFEDSTEYGMRHHRFTRLLLDHPADNRFSADDFLNEAQVHGLHVDGYQSPHPAWFAGVAHKSTSRAMTGAD